MTTPPQARKMPKLARNTTAVYAPGSNYMPRASAVSISSIHASGLRDLPSLKGATQASASDEVEQVGQAGGFCPFFRQNRGRVSHPLRVEL